MQVSCEDQNEGHLKLYSVQFREQFLWECSSGSIVVTDLLMVHVDLDVGSVQQTSV